MPPVLRLLQALDLIHHASSVITVSSSARLGSFTYRVIYFLLLLSHIELEYIVPSDSSLCVRNVVEARRDCAGMEEDGEVGRGVETAAGRRDEPRTWRFQKGSGRVSRPQHRRRFFTPAQTRHHDKHSPMTLLP